MIALLVIGAWLCGGLGCFYSYRIGVDTGRRAELSDLEAALDKAWRERRPLVSTPLRGGR